MSSNASKCDGCGTLFEIAPGTIWIETYYVNDRNRKGGLGWTCDLCLECGKKFIALVGHPQGHNLAPDTSLVQGLEPK